MPWYVPYVPETIKKKVCVYLLQRYLGQFFEEKLTVDQLTVDLYNGTGTVTNVSLDVQALNDLGENQNWPMEFVDGYLEELYVSIPWTSLLKDSSFLQVKGLKLTVQPKQRNEPATSMFESMWSSMTNSMQLAKECMKQDANEPVDNSQPLEGLERFAQIIDSILCRVRVKFINTVLQIEHVPKDSSTGVAILINIDVMEYTDEAGKDPPPEEITDINNQELNKGYIVTSFTTKNFTMEGVKFSTVEFPSKARTFSRSVMSQSYEHNESEQGDSLTVLLQSTNLNDNLSSDEVEREKVISSEKEHIEESENEEKEKLNPFSEERHVVMFGRLSGKQEIKIRLKQNETIIGPKVSIEVTIGSLIMFLSPRQVHVLIELASGFASPDLEDTSNVAPRQKCVEKPMTELDYQRVEQELQQRLHPLSTFRAPGLQGAYGWSSAPLEENDDEKFLPMHSNINTAMFDSTISNTSSMESSLNSSLASSFTEQSIKNRIRKKGCNIETDPTAEISRFQIRLASLALVILHEDLLAISSDTQTLIPSSVQQMQNTATSFFNNLGLFAITSYGSKDFNIARSVFEKACKLNHMRLLAAPVQIEGDETTTSSAFSLTGNLTSARLEILECLHTNEKVEYVPILTFKDSVTIESSLATKPCLKLTINHIEHCLRTGLARKSNTRTDIGINLDTCTFELDITIVDRISALLNRQPICIVNSSNKAWKTKTAFPLDVVQTENKFDIKISSPSLTVKLRFPVPDFRPPHDMQRVPWWKRNVRPDYLNLKFSDCCLQTSTFTNQSFEKYSLQAKTVDVHYYDNENSFPIELGKVTLDDKCGMNLGLIKVLLKIYPVKKPSELESKIEPEVDIMTQSLYGDLNVNNKEDVGPFSSKRVVHESDTPHTKPQQEDSEEMILPGDKNEMDHFMESATDSSRIQIEIHLPIVTLQLESKHLYEVIYNRINTDLLLWEPSAPKPKFHHSDVNTVVEGTFSSFMPQDRFKLCKSGIQYDSDSDEDDDFNSDKSGVYYSVYEQRMKNSQKTCNLKYSGQSSLTLNLHIGCGVLVFYSPVRDVATSNVIPGQRGDFVLNLDSAKIFSVSGYKGDDDLGYVCLSVKSAKLFHNEMSSSPNQTAPIKDVSSATSKHLHLTIHQSEQGVLVDSNNRGGERDMFSMAIKIQANHETHHVKTIRVAVGVNKATLLHRVVLEPNTWISQMIDFFNVQDYPIPGYIAKDVLTELHLHLWDCAIDYRPLNLPLRTVITMGNFSMSSHLSALANTSTLRFIAEECNLFISDKPISQTIPAHVILNKDYICVVDVGLFELSLRINDKKSGINPHIDLRASNNIVHIRTCSDSARALMQLITYFASDGDLIKVEEEISTSNSFSSPHRKLEEELVSVEPQDISNLSKSQHQQVNDLIGEAMEEETISIEDTETIEYSPLGAKLFFFPDEKNPIPDTIKPVSQVTTDLGDLTYRTSRNSDTDDDFCIIGDEAGLGIVPKNGLPEIKWLTDDPVRIIDNHFTVPLGKTDLLKPPKHYPIPVLRYTLCEMSLIWYMYGGSDFKTEVNEKSEKRVNFSDLQVQGVGFSNKDTGEIIFSGFLEKKPKLPWQKKGGVNRDHNVLMELQLNKVKFTHEIYPEHTTEASRQVLLITELEVRDRLESSQINKFLYQYTSEARPKQSHAHMFVLKALHIRPDAKLKSQECCLKISILPLRLNIDQDSLLFLISFFTELGGGGCKTDETAAPATNSKHNTPIHQPPVMTISVNEKEVVKKVHEAVDENLMLLIEEDKKIHEEDNYSSIISNDGKDTPIYFRSIIFSPEVPIRLDYQGKRVDMSHGPLAGLLMGLGQLNCSELCLKRISNRHGILGVEKLLNYMLQEWLNDIKKNQLPSLLGGVGPMHSLVQLFQGIKDLFWMPIEQYQKDGRIVRGLQRGANSFTTSTAMAALELTTRIIHLIQITAETAYDMMSPGPSVRRRSKLKGRKKRYSQPQDIREGMANAFNVVREGIGETADNIVRVASHEHEQKGYSGAVGSVLRQIPPTLVKPIIVASEATNNVLGGMRSQLVPDARREANQKWRSDDR